MVCTRARIEEGPRDVVFAHVAVSAVQLHGGRSAGPEPRWSTSHSRTVGELLIQMQPDEFVGHDAHRGQHGSPIRPAGKRLFWNTRSVCRRPALMTYCRVSQDRLHGGSRRDGDGEPAPGAGSASGRLSPCLLADEVSPPGTFTSVKGRFGLVSWASADLVGDVRGSKPGIPARRQAAKPCAPFSGLVRPPRSPGRR